MTVHYGLVQENGDRAVWFDGKPAGILKAPASQLTLESSPGIQGWSHPRGKVATKMFEPNAVIKLISSLL